MKAVLISIQPKWCELIASGKKTVEVRKTRPELETPFKVYIYQTKKTWVYNIFSKIADWQGKVIGEFVCDKIFVADCDSVAPFDKHTKRYIDKESCLSKEEFVKYTRMCLAYGWSISNLVIYDEPKELCEFRSASTYGRELRTKFFGKDPCCVNDYRLSRPPQSWCYVEGVETE